MKGGRGIGATDASVLVWTRTALRPEPSRRLPAADRVDPPRQDGPSDVAHWSTLASVTIAATLGSCRGDEPARLSRDDQHEISHPRRPG